MPKKEPSFEQSLAKLEELAERMESGESSLAELMKNYEAGMRLAESLKAQLDQAQAQLQEIHPERKPEQQSLLDLDNL